MKLNEIERIAKSRIECKSMSTIRRLQHMQDEEKYHASVLKMIERLRAADTVIRCAKRFADDTVENPEFEDASFNTFQLKYEKYRQLSEVGDA